MPQYRWERDDPFRDHANSRTVERGEVVDLPENVAGPQPGFVEVEADATDAGDAEADTADGAEDTPLAEKEYSELRQMAVEADTDEINGRSSKDEIVEYFESND